MRHHDLIILSAVLIAVMTIAAVATGLATHDGLLPTHWSLNGVPDRFAPKWAALLMMPVVGTAITLALGLLPFYEPAKDGLNRSGGLIRAAWVSTLLVLAVAELVTIGAARHWDLPVAAIIIGAVGLCLMATGNQLGKSRRMSFVGIRTPWTLADEDIWIATHRLAGRLIVAAGLIFLLVALAGAPPWITAPVLACALVLIVVVPVVYSWKLWTDKTPTP